MAVVVATGVTATGGRKILGVDVGDSEGEVFWRGFLRTLRERGLSGVQLVISDQHAGLVAASGKHSRPMRKARQRSCIAYVTVERRYGTEHVEENPYTPSSLGVAFVPRSTRSQSGAAHPRV
jgi:transposase-like protein